MRTLSKNRSSQSSGPSGVPDRQRDSSRLGAMKLCTSSSSSWWTTFCMPLTFRSLTLLSPVEVAITLVDDGGEEVTFLFTGEQHQGGISAIGEPAFDGHYRLVPGPSLPMWPERLATAALRAVREPLPDAETLALLTAQGLEDLERRWQADKARSRGTAAFEGGEELG